MKKSPHAHQMAGEQDDYLRVRVPTGLHDRFKAAVKRRSDKSKVIRFLLEAYCDADDAGDTLLPPLVVKAKGKK